MTKSLPDRLLLACGLWEVKSGNHRASVCCINPTLSPHFRNRAVLDG